MDKACSKNINEVEFVIFDTETTGLEPRSGDRIVEIAGLRFKGAQTILTFQTLVNPQRKISPGAFAVNKISQEMVDEAPAFGEILPGFLKFIEGSCLCSYNAPFDLGFLNNELALLGKKELAGQAVVDVLRMARRLLPGLERYALWFVAQSLGIENKQSHRAFSDVELTLGVFNKLKEMLNLKGVTDLTHFLSLFAINEEFSKSLSAQKISEIQRAIDQGIKLQIKYLSISGLEVTEREVVPKEIKQENNRSYLVGFCQLRNEERTFRIDGILHLEVV